MRPLMLLMMFGIHTAVAGAEESAFTNGPVFKDYGPVADVEETSPIPSNTVLRHSFDVSTRAPDGRPNRTLESAARFINMHARAGIPGDRIRVAVVVHGKAVHDVSDDDAASAGLVAALVGQGVRIIVCGQSAVYYGVTADDLLPGVEMALSAMTVHALLQQQGYTINPF